MNNAKKVHVLNYLVIYSQNFGQEAEYCWNIIKSLCLSCYKTIWSYLLRLLWIKSAALSVWGGGGGGWASRLGPDYSTKHRDIMSPNIDKYHKQFSTLVRPERKIIRLIHTHTRTMYTVHRINTHCIHSERLHCRQRCCIITKLKNNFCIVRVQV